jgi:hypothetical protein
MNIRNLVGAIVVALAVFGCASQTGMIAQDTKPCPGASCDIEVWVDESDGKVTVKVDADVLQMARGNRDAEIIWKLKNSPKYEFRRTTIAPHTAAPTGKKQTTTQSAWDDQIAYEFSSAVLWIAKNKNSKSVILYYDVTVWNKMTGTAYKLDPAIMNDV